jgi:hypothetical protein
MRISISRIQANHKWFQSSEREISLIQVSLEEVVKGKEAVKIKEKKQCRSTFRINFSEFGMHLDRFYTY